MINSFIYGLGTGIVLSSMLGTVFFFLLQNSIQNGVKSAVYVSLGVIISDIVLIIVSYFNAKLFPQGGVSEMLVRVIGAIILIVMGITNIRKHHQVINTVVERKSPFLLSAKGFILNISNPGNYLSWLTVAATLNNVLHYNNQNKYLYYSGALIAIFGMEMLIAYGAITLKKFIKPLFLKRLDIIIGVLFIVFALLLLWPIVNK